MFRKSLTVGDAIGVRQSFCSSILKRGFHSLPPHRARETQEQGGTIESRKANQQQSQQSHENQQSHSKTAEKGRNTSTTDSTAKNPDPHGAFKVTSRTSRFGIESKVASKVPRYQARYEDATIVRVYNQTKMGQVLKKVREHLKKNEIPDNIPRKERLKLIFKKYGYLYIMIIFFWACVIYIYRSVTRKSIPVLSVDNWSAYIDNIIYTTRTYFRINGRIPMSLNSTAVKLSNGDVLLYNPGPPQTHVLKFLLELLMFDAPHNDSSSSTPPNDHQNKVNQLLSDGEAQSQASSTPKKKTDILNQILSHNKDRVLHIIVPNDLPLSFVSEYFQYSNPNILKIHFYAYEKNKKFLSSIQEWIDSRDSPLEITFISSPSDFPSCIKDDFDINIVTELTNMNEIVLFHCQSKVAIMCDITQNVVRGKTLPTDFTRTRLVENILYWNGNIGVFGRIPPKSVVADDYNALRQKMQAISEWGFTGLIMSCGELIHPNEMSNVHVEFLKRWFGVISKKSGERLNDMQSGRESM